MTSPDHLAGMGGSGIGDRASGIGHRGLEIGNLNEDLSSLLVLCQ